jgi:hypothetical protein
MLDESEIPNPVAADAPSPDDVDSETVRTPGTSLSDVVAVDHDGARYCMECANPAYVELCREDPRQIPYGGPVDRGSEVDCPGSSCDNCLRRIGDMSILHYDAVCDPFSCPDMTVWVADPDGVRDPVEAALLERDGGDVLVMLREDFGSHGERGDESWIPESDLRRVDEERYAGP